MTFFGKTFTADDFRRVVWTAVQAAAASYAVLAPGFWQAPNLVNAKALGVAVLVAAGAAALSVIKNWWLADSSAVK